MATKKSRYCPVVPRGAFAHYPPRCLLSSATASRWPHFPRAAHRVNNFFFLLCTVQAIFSRLPNRKKHVRPAQKYVDGKKYQAKSFTSTEVHLAREYPLFTFKALVHRHQKQMAKTVITRLKVVLQEEASRKRLDRFGISTCALVVPRYQFACRYCLAYKNMARVVVPPLT